MTTQPTLTTATRRTVLHGGLALAAATTALPGQASAATHRSDASRSTGTETMPMITTKDGTEIFYKYWGKGQPVVFSHGWPLTADAFEDQMFFLASQGYRCIGHDRRGHGRSGQAWAGNDIDT